EGTSGSQTRDAEKSGTHEPDRSENRDRYTMERAEAAHVHLSAAYSPTDVAETRIAGIEHHTVVNVGGRTRGDETDQRTHQSEPHGRLAHGIWSVVTGGSEVRQEPRKNSSRVLRFPSSSGSARALALRTPRTREPLT